jgi:hypothetical protein
MLYYINLYLQLILEILKHQKFQICQNKFFNNFKINYIVLYTNF